MCKNTKKENLKRVDEKKFSYWTETRKFSIKMIYSRFNSRIFPTQSSCMIPRNSSKLTLKIN